MGYAIYYEGELTVTPALSKSDEAIFTAIVNLKTSEDAQPILDAIKRQEGAELPYYGKLLTVSDDGTTLLPEEGESREGLEQWLVLLLEHFFIPRGYALAGLIDWIAEDPYDRGSIYVNGEKVEVVEDVIYNHGPSWDSRVSLSPKAKELVQQLVDTADDTGCTPDLLVVGAAQLKALQGAIATPPPIDAGS